MSTLASILADDNTGIYDSDEWGGPRTLTFGAQTVAANIGPESRSKEMQDAGYLLTYDRQAVVNKSLFTTEPAENATVTITDGAPPAVIKYRVERLTDDSVALTLDLKRIN